MRYLFKCFICILPLLGLLSCKKEKTIGKPIIAYDFNNNLSNSGLAKTAVYGPQSVAFAYEKEDTCLDLSIDAFTRQALSIKFKDHFSFNDYKGFSIACWVKKYPTDPEAYTILAQLQKDSISESGWKIKTQANGAWEWWFSDGRKSWEYQPTNQQCINDDKWHLLTFAYDGSTQQANLYYDGRNVAIYSLVGNQLRFNSSFIQVGADEYTNNGQDLFNGQIDDLNIWSRVISDEEVLMLYKQRKFQCRDRQSIKKSFKVMSWNLWDGGIHDGKFVGVQRIVNKIEKESPDIILLQESGNACINIADALDYKLYRRSKNLSVLSRFPIRTTHNIFKSDIIACIELEIKKDQNLVVCPIHLSETPNLSDYIRSGEAVVDSILEWESDSRGREVQFMMSEMGHLIFNSDQKPMIIGGDFNSGSHLDWTDKNAKNNSGLTVAFPTTLQIEEKGFSDSFRAIHPDETIDFGYTYSPRIDSVMKNRSSFIFFKGNQLVPTESYTLNDCPYGFPSDHAAVITIFEWQNK
jgi:endonuclease/exonuclease/phosphatase family metal-dependent hydrolase